MSRPGTPADSGRPATPSTDTDLSRPNTPSDSRKHYHKKRHGTKTGIVFRQDAPPRSIDEEEMDELREAFKLFDQDGDGTMNKEELGTVMRSLGQDVNDKNLDAIFQSVDHDASGCICFDEFIHLMSKYLPATGSTDAELKEAFAFFDKAGSGEISFDEIEQTVHQLGFDITPAQMKNMLTCADSDQDGLVTFDDFKHMWVKDDDDHHKLMGGHAKDAPSKKRLLGAEIAEIHD